MHFLEKIYDYNNNNTGLEELIYELSENIGNPTNRGVAHFFAKDVINKNKIVKPIYVKKDNEIYRFYCGENELFKVTGRAYNVHNTSKSALRCSLLPTSYINYVLSNDQFEAGSYGLYEDFSDDLSYTNYRYISIKNNGIVDYEAIIDKEKSTMQKNYYSKDYEIIGRFYYTIKLKKNDGQYGAAIDKISSFLAEEHSKLSRDEYDRYFSDISDQFFYDIELTDKKEKYKDIYAVNGSSIIVEKSDNSILDAISIKGQNNYNKENYLAISHPTLNDLKILCVTDFVNGSRLHKKFQDFISLELKKWFLNLDALTLKDNNELIKSLGKKILSLNSFVTKQVSSIRKNNNEICTKVIGSAIGIALITKHDTYIINYGDTRIYVTKGNDFYPVTLDDTIVWDLYRKNEISREEAIRCQKGSILTRYIGRPDNLPELYQINNLDYDKLFIFTDGVTDNLNDEKLNSIAQSYGNNEILGKIVLEAYNKQKEHDDVTGCCYIKR